MTLAELAKVQAHRERMAARLREMAEEKVPLSSAAIALDDYNKMAAHVKSLDSLDLGKPLPSKWNQP